VPGSAQPEIYGQSDTDTTPGDDGTATAHAGSSAGTASTVDAAAGTSARQNVPAGQGSGAYAPSADQASVAAYATYRSSTISKATVDPRTFAYVANTISYAVDLPSAPRPQPSDHPLPEVAPVAATVRVGEPAPLAAAHKDFPNLVTTDRPLGSLASARPQFVLAAPLDVAPENPPSTPTGEQLASAVLPPPGLPAFPAPQLETLVTGAVPIDLAALQQAANAFFARLEGLAEEVTGKPVSLPWTRWLVLTVMAVGAYEFFRVWVRPAAASRSSGADGDASWAPFPVLAVIPPEDVS
jgi:hypothetical protein